MFTDFYLVPDQSYIRCFVIEMLSNGFDMQLRQGDNLID